MLLPEDHFAEDAMRPARLWKLLWTLLWLAGSAAILPADTLTRITELGPGDDDGFDGLAAAVLGDELFFVGRLPAGGSALWRYGGAAPPTLVPDSDELDPGQELVAWNGKLYFAAAPAGDRELWVFDPGDGSFAEAVDVRAGGNGNPEELTVRGDRICFAAFGDTIGRELACWDGSGPADLYDLAPGADSSFPVYLAATGDRLAFAAETGGGERLWIYAGANPPAPVEPAPGEPYDSPCCFVQRGQETFFQAADAASIYRLWRHDGAAPPAPVSDSFEPGGFGGLFRDRLVVAGADPTVGVEDEELWRFTPSGPRRLAPGLQVQQSDRSSILRGALFLRGYVGGASDHALYRWCGAGRAAALSDPLGGSDPSIASDLLVAFAGRLFFTATDATHGQELWALDSSHLFCDDLESGNTGWWTSAQP